MTVQYGDHILTALVAPEFVALQTCGAPEIDGLPNYQGSYFLNNLFRTDVKDRCRPVEVVFFRHLSLAVREYRMGRELLVACVQETTGAAAQIFELPWLP